MILFSGLWLIIFTTYKWKVPHVIWDDKRYRLCSRILGGYHIILAVLSYFLKVKIPISFFVVAFLLFLLLDICFAITKIKKARKAIILNIQLGICFLLFLCGLLIVCLDVNEVASAISGLCGAMMLLTTPLEEIKPFLEGKRNASKQE